MTRPDEVALAYAGLIAVGAVIGGLLGRRGLRPPRPLALATGAVGGALALVIVVVAGPWAEGLLGPAAQRSLDGLLGLLLGVLAAAATAQLTAAAVARLAGLVAAAVSVLGGLAALHVAVAVRALVEMTPTMTRFEEAAMAVVVYGFAGVLGALVGVLLGAATSARSKPLLAGAAAVVGALAALLGAGADRPGAWAAGFLAGAAVLVGAGWASARLSGRAANVVAVLGWLVMLPAATVSFVLLGFDGELLPRTHAPLWPVAAMTGLFHDGELGVGSHGSDLPLWAQLSRAVGSLLLVLTVAWAFLAGFGAGRRERRRPAAPATVDARA